MTQLNTPKQQFGALMYHMFRLHRDSDPSNMRYPFYAHLISQHPVYLDNKLPAIAAVELSKKGIAFHFNPELFFQFNIDEQMGIIEHECLHILQQSFARMPKSSGNKQMQEIGNVWNLAVDVAVNQAIPNFSQTNKIGDVRIFNYESLVEIIEDFNSKAPDQNLHVDPKMIPKDANSEYYYDLLTNLKKNSKDPNGDGDGDGDSESEGGEGDPKGGGESDKETQSRHWGVKDLFSGDKNGGDKHLIDGDLSPEEARELARKAVNNAAKRAGNLPGNLARLIAEMNEVKVDWESILAAWAASVVTSDKTVTKSRAHRRYGLRLPGNRPKVQSKLWVGVDASGSITPEILNRIASHLVAIKATGCEVRYAIFDSEVRAHGEFTGEFPDFEAGGGTEFQPVFDLVDEEGDAAGIIMLTDGYNSDEITEPNCRVLWGVLASDKSDYPFGDVLMIDNIEGEAT